MADNPADNNEPLKIHRSAPPDWLPKIHSHADLGQFRATVLEFRRLFTRLSLQMGLQVTICFSRHVRAKKKTIFPSRMSRMG